MDGDEVPNATTPTTQCTTCWCPKAQLSDTDVVFTFRNTDEGRERVADERKRLRHGDGKQRDSCQEKVYMPGVLMSYSKDTLIVSLTYEWSILNLRLSYSRITVVIFQDNACHIPRICLSYFVNAGS